MNVTHTCAGVDHVTDIQPAITDALGCGCTRHRGIRCDGSRIEWLNPAVCGLHRTEETA